MYIENLLGLVESAWLQIGLGLGNKFKVVIRLHHVILGYDSSRDAGIFEISKWRQWR